MTETQSVCCWRTLRKKAVARGVPRKWSINMLVSISQSISDAVPIAGAAYLQTPGRLLRLSRCLPFRVTRALLLVRQGGEIRESPQNRPPRLAVRPVVVSACPRSLRCSASPFLHCRLYIESHGCGETFATSHIALPRLRQAG